MNVNAFRGALVLIYSDFWSCLIQVYYIVYVIAYVCDFG